MYARQSYGHVYRVWEAWSDKPWRLSCKTTLGFLKLAIAKLPTEMDEQIVCSVDLRPCKIFCKLNQLGTQIFLTCLLLFSTCFGQLCVHHQKKIPYTWNLSLWYAGLPPYIPGSHVFIHSFISIQPLGWFGRNQSSVRWPVWLWHAAFLRGRLPLLSPAF